MFNFIFIFYNTTNRKANLKYKFYEYVIAESDDLELIRVAKHVVGNVLELLDKKEKRLLHSCNPKVIVDDSLDMKSEQFANIISIVKQAVVAYIENILKTMKKDGSIRIAEKEPNDYFS